VQQPVLLRLYSPLKAPVAPHGHQSRAQSVRGKSERQLGGGGSVTQTVAAAGPGDGVVHGEDVSMTVFTARFFGAAALMHFQLYGTKLWRKQR